MCPPNLISLDEFRKALALYSKGILIQVETDLDSRDKAKRDLDERLCSDLDSRSAKWKLKLHRIVNEIETLAFKQGGYLAAGFIGGDCALCERCVAIKGETNCRFPFKARPSMEAMGIDVIKTCSKAGMPIYLSSPRRVRWTGLVLVE